MTEVAPCYKPLKMEFFPARKPLNTGFLRRAVKASIPWAFGVESLKE